jgi:hypothetical protein
MVAALGGIDMQVHNRDVFPAPETQKIYGLVKPLIANVLIDGPFLDHENAANQAKRNFHKNGRLAMSLVLLSTLFTVLDGLVLRSLGNLEALSILFIVLGILGLCLQVYLLVTRKKQDWLQHRFAAERLRSIKFQAYQLAAVAQSEDDLREKVNDFYSKEAARLDSELNAGYSALMNFSPGKSLARDWVASNPPANAMIGVCAADAYHDLRILYQKRFAEGQILQLQQRQRIGYTAADILYLSGAGLAITALMCKTAFPSAAVLRSWVDFSAVAAFVLGLMLTIMDNASLVETSKVRYEDYVRALEECQHELKSANASFPDVVRRIERVALEELSDFCQAASQISYRL